MERQTPQALPVVSVVIPSYNRCQSLAEVLDGLTQQTYPAERFEVVVVLDGSADGSREMLAGWAQNDRLGGRLTTIWQENQGAARARNRGAEAARGEVLLFLDDDVVPDPGLVAAHARAYAERPGSAVLGPMRLAPHCTPSVVVEGEVEWYGRHFSELARPDYEFSCWDFFAGNSSVARADFVAVGGFDDGFTTYGCEDWELGLRLLKAGRHVRFCPDAVGEHRYRVDIAGWLHRAYGDGRSQVRFARKHPEVKRRLQFTVGRWSPWRCFAMRLVGMAPGLGARLRPLLLNLFTRAERSGQRGLRESLRACSGRTITCWVSTTSLDGPVV